MKPKYCQCGCKGILNQKYKNHIVKFLVGHHTRMPECRKNMSKSAYEYFKNNKHHNLGKTKENYEPLRRTSETLKKRYREDKNLKCGFKKGDMPHNYKYKDGRNQYIKIAFQYLPHKCNICNITNIKVLIVHHKDNNRKNNKIKNLEILCCNCHAERHYKNVSYWKKQK